MRRASTPGSHTGHRRSKEAHHDPRPPVIAARVALDVVDLDELFRDSQPVGDLSDLAIPDFFETDEEYDEYQDWLKAQRAADVA